jgi:N-acetylglucosamine kinase-like BadF-type ATPase
MEEGWGPATALHRMLLGATGSTDANDLLHRLYTSEFSRPEVAALSQLVTEAAEAGDAVASDLLREAAAALSFYVEGAHRNLFASEACSAICYIGGVFRSKLLLSSFQKVVQQRLGVSPSAPKLSPAAGALIEALRRDGNAAELSGVPESEK